MLEKDSEIRFPDDMPLLCAMCSSEQIWRFVARKRKDSELYKARSKVWKTKYGEFFANKFGYLIAMASN